MKKILLLLFLILILAYFYLFSESITRADIYSYHMITKNCEEHIETTFEKAQTKECSCDSTTDPNQEICGFVPEPDKENETTIDKLSCVTILEQYRGGFYSCNEDKIRISSYSWGACGSSLVYYKLTNNEEFKLFKLSNVDFDKYGFGSNCVAKEYEVSSNDENVLQLKSLDYLR